MKSPHFYVNGKPFHVQNPDPRNLLVDFLRSSEVGLTGTKKSCAQGGCTLNLNSNYQSSGDVAQTNISSNKCFKVS